MYILRSVTLNDLNDLYELSGKVLFINLPHDKDIIESKINSSLNAFKHPDKKLEKNYYIFVLEDYETKKVVGVSMIHAQHGTEVEPHFYLTVAHEHKYSQTINTGFVHGTLKLGLETNGPTEIGGLVIHPEYRGNKSKLGKQISFVRFLYLGMFPERFKNEIHSELMPPLDKDGHAPLWEAIGRRFLNMEYCDADVLSRSNKEFILSLYPSETIYMTLLPIEARNAVGKVSPDTMPVKKMLEDIGFKYTNEVDPFDGGPHYRANLNEITLLKNKFSGIARANNENVKATQEMVVAIPVHAYDFCAVKVNVAIKNDEILLPKELWQHFDLPQSFKTMAINF